MPGVRHSQSRQARAHHSPRSAAGRRLNFATVMLTLLVTVGCVSPAMIKYRGELREQRATADRLCEERGGLEIYEPIPEMMDVLSVFLNAGPSEVKPGPGDPYLGGTTNYIAITPAPVDEMALFTLKVSVQAYGKVAHFISTGRVGAVDLVIENFQYHDNYHKRNPGGHNGNLLPDRELPNGMYRYALVNEGNPGCANFDEMISAFRNQVGITGYAPRHHFNQAVVRNGKCIAITYLGTKEDYSPPGYVYHEYRNDLRDLEVRQIIDELIAPNGDVIARLRNFSAGTRRGHCEGGNVNIFEHFVYE